MPANWDYSIFLAMLRAGRNLMPLCLFITANIDLQIKKIRNVDLNGSHVNAYFDDVDDHKKTVTFCLSEKCDQMALACL